jgi:hypothetical protein
MGSPEAFHYRSRKLQASVLRQRVYASRLDNFLLPIMQPLFVQSNQLSIQTDTSPLGLPLRTWFITTSKQAYMRIALLDRRVLKAPTEYHERTSSVRGAGVSVRVRLSERMLL